MKARPILFNTDMVKAILAGRKTQTRREIKPHPFAMPECNEETWEFEVYAGDELSGSLRCPYGQPGDLLYVRETFRLYDSPMECACYDYCTCSRHHGKPMYFADGFCAGDELKWKPSIHMPRWASRLTLEITDVRVERLHEISEEGAQAEGVMQVQGKLDAESNGYSPRELFSMLWESIYSNWDANPWVWVIEFKVHHCNVGALLGEREVA